MCYWFEELFNVGFLDLSSIGFTVSDVSVISSRGLSMSGCPSGPSFSGRYS